MSESSANDNAETTPSSSPSLLAHETKAEFEYESLDHNTDAFRLLKVLPSRSADGLLQLTLWHDVVSSASYHCLSYRWGDQSHRHTVLLNGKRFTIGGNLHGFLEAVFSRYCKDSPDDAFKALFVDAISIDQSCVRERGHQVQQMGKIYNNAIGVLVWLGEHRLSDELLEWLHLPQRSYNSSLLSGVARDQWDVLRFNAYWYRAWIAQEILLATNVTIILPRTSLDWIVFGRAVVMAAEENSDDLVVAEGKNPALQLFCTWNDRRSKISRAGSKGWSSVCLDTEYSTAWGLIHAHRRSRCTDPRDRIYSLLGLFDKGHGFAVDYDESAADLFWRAGEHFSAWDAPELIDSLRVALLQSHGHDREDAEICLGDTERANPLTLIHSLRNKPDLRVRIPIRRAWPTTSLLCRLTRRVKCKFEECRDAPKITCTRNDMLLCTNAQSNLVYVRTANETHSSSGSVLSAEHGCIHALASRPDKPAAELFEITLIAHHGRQHASTTLPPTALQVLDRGIERWVGVSTWSSLQKALENKDLDRTDRVKLQVPAKYAVWIWFGVHPNHLEKAYKDYPIELPSAHHALPPGSKITRDSIEVPPISVIEKGETRVKEGIFE